MRFRIEFSRSARRQFDDLPAHIRKRIAPRIDALVDDPRPPGVQQLAGEETLFRIRIGDYRVIYAIEGERLVVLIVKVGHRRDVYRRT